MLRAGGHLSPVHDGDARHARVAELVPRVEDGAHQRVALVERRHPLLAAELAHRLEAREQLGEPVRVGAAEGALGVQLDHLEVVRREDGVEARQDAEGLVLRLVIEEPPLAVREREQVVELRVRDDAVPGLGHGGSEAGDGPLDEVVLRAEDEVGPEEGAEGPAGEDGTPRDEAAREGEVILAPLRDVGVEQGVVALDGIVHRGLPGLLPRGRREHRGRPPRRPLAHRADPSGPMTGVDGSRSLAQR